MAANDSRAVRLILVGPPGVGKGTQAAILQNNWGIVPVSSGDIFRAELKAESDLGKLAKKYMEAGDLVPDDVTIGMMRKRLGENDVRDSGFVLDGFPRTVAQAEALDRTLAEMDLKVDLVVSLEVDDEIVVSRLGGRLCCSQCGEIFHKVNKPPKQEGVCDKCGGDLFVRKDDQPDTIRDRLRVFKETTQPVVGYYESVGSLLRVDASGEADSVFVKIDAELNT